MREPKFKEGDRVRYVAGAEYAPDGVDGGHQGTVTAVLETHDGGAEYEVTLPGSPLGDYQLTEAMLAPLADAVLNERYRSAQAEVRMADREVNVTSRKVRQALDQIDSAIDQGLSAPSGVTGGPFVASDADNLCRALIARETAYRKQHDIAYLAAELGITLADAS